MTIRIRAGNLADRDALVAFHHALYVEHRDRLVPRDLQALGAYRDLPSVLRADVDALLKGTDTVVLIGEQSGLPVGYATGRIENDLRRELRPKGIVEDWYVEESARGRGIGKALFEDLLTEFRNRGCAVAESRTWPTNRKALEAHRRAGFHEVEIMLRRRLDND